MRTTIQNRILVLIFGFFLLAAETAHGQSPYLKNCLDGISLEEVGDYQGAKIKYTQAIALKQEQFEAYNFRGKVNFRLKEYENSVEDMTNAIFYKPTDISSYNIRARAYAMMLNYPSAIADYSHLLSIIKKKDPLYKKVKERRAYYYAAIQQYSEAISEYSELISSSLVNKETPQLYWYQNRAEAYIHQERYSDALPDIEKVLNQYPSSKKYIYLKGWACYKSGDQKQAAQLAERYISLDPSKEDFYKKKGISSFYDYFTNLGQIESQLKALQISLQNSINLPSGNLRSIELTGIYQDLHKLWDQKITVFQENAAISDSLRNSMMQAYAQLTQKPAISEDARKLIVQATLATKEKQYDKAIQLYTQSIEIEPCDHLAFYNLALLFANNNNFGKAIEEMKTYVQLYPNAPDVRQAKDKIYEWEDKMKTTVISDSDPELMNELKNPYKEKNAKFMLAYGSTQPRGNCALFNPNETPETRLFGSGKIGLQKGFYAEMGVAITPSGLGFNTYKKVHFLFEPFNFRYSQNQLDWRTAGGIFANKTAYTKDFRLFEFGEKFGLHYTPIPKLFISFYYKPAIIMNFFQTEISQKTGEFEWSEINISGDSYVRLSNTIGFAAQYKILSIGYEFYSANLKCDLRNYYHDATELNATGFDITTTGKIPLKFGTIRLALYL